MSESYSHHDKVVSDPGARPGVHVEAFECAVCGRKHEWPGAVCRMRKSREGEYYTEARMRDARMHHIHLLKGLPLHELEPGWYYRCIDRRDCDTVAAELSQRSLNVR